MRKMVRTAEAVSFGHPDKFCDLVSDSVLDYCLTINPKARVACEVLASGSTIVVAGEISGVEDIPVEKIVNQCIEKVFYDIEELKIINLLQSQSSDIAIGVDRGNEEEQGAGDQGIICGYACNETISYMPLPIYLANTFLACHRLLIRDYADVIGSDAKSQVSVCYEDGVPKHIDVILMSIQHSETVDSEFVRKFVEEHIIPEAISMNPFIGLFITDATKIVVNPTGRFVVGGIKGDTGLTGRKIVVDSYGDVGAVGGGAFSGKDPSKVDRSAAYMLRYIAKNLVEAEVADAIELKISYAIGVSEPVSLTVIQTNPKYTDEFIEEIIRSEFDLTPYGIRKTLNLENPIYGITSSYGHFGRESFVYDGLEFFPWEKTNKVEEIKKVLSLRVNELA